MNTAGSDGANGAGSGVTGAGSDEANAAASLESYDAASDGVDDAPAPP
jgi:hypothetical protein